LAFTVEIKRKALRFIEELDDNRKRRITQIIVVLKDDSVPFKREDAVKLKGYDSTYRIRVGELRLSHLAKVLYLESLILARFMGS